MEQPQAEPGYLDQRPAFLPLVLAAILAALGAAAWPYSYYEFLRIVLSITAVFVGVHAIRSRQRGWLALAIPMLVLWAPAAWVTLPKPVWEVLDVGVAIALCVAGARIPTPIPVDGESAPWPWWKLALVVYGIGAFVGLLISGPGGLPPDCVLEYGRSGATCA